MTKLEIHYCTSPPGGAWGYHCSPWLCTCRSFVVRYLSEYLWWLWQDSFRLGSRPISGEELPSTRSKVIFVIFPCKSLAINLDENAMSRATLHSAPYQLWYTARGSSKQNLITRTSQSLAASIVRLVDVDRAGTNWSALLSENEYFWSFLALSSSSLLLRVHRYHPSLDHPWRRHEF